MSVYQPRDRAEYFDKRPRGDGEIVHQPDAYELAAFLAVKYGADTIIHIGCGSGQKTRIDFGLNLESCSQRFQAVTWIPADLEMAHKINIPEVILRRSIVICADVIQHLLDPRGLLTLLGDLSRLVHAVIITTPERDLVRGEHHVALPPNPAHVQEWNLDEFLSLLEGAGLSVAFAGLTVNSSISREKKTIIAVIDRLVASIVEIPPDEFRPVAIFATFNDGEIIVETTAKMLDDGIDVRVLDNWSQDGTFETLQSLSRYRPGLAVERFPSDQAMGFNWAATLDRKAEIAVTYPDRWIVHHDSDEIRCAPWPRKSFRSGLWIADRCGFNAIDFTVIDFRPISASFVSGCKLEQTLTMFEFGKRPGHFLQTKVWKQGDRRVSLSKGGGHDVQFNGRKVFPYKFLLKHYPLRSPEHARKKIFAERLPRYAPELKSSGWHSHYDRYSQEEEFIWKPEGLIEFQEPVVWRDYLLEFISGIGIAHE
ncbi:hypothetical protein [Pseudorhodoplanes sp.]|uniref:hypothetical protein n=1 Tax=Pseudorhodoplanes sp. TaxID=1934341 RepID=UPI00391D53E1